MLSKVNDKNELRAAAGAFGLLGVVVALTLQLDDMGVTDMMPVKVPVPLAIPPPAGYTIPYEAQKIMDEYDVTPEQLEAAQADFERRCREDYYLEWFWFPYQDECWVNTWQSECEFEDISRTVTYDAGLVERPTEIKDVNMKTYPDADDQAWQVVSLSCSKHSASLQ